MDITRHSTIQSIFLVLTCMQQYTRKLGYYCNVRVSTDKQFATFPIKAHPTNFDYLVDLKDTWSIFPSILVPFNETTA